MQACGRAGVTEHRIESSVSLCPRKKYRYAEKDVTKVPNLRPTRALRTYTHTYIHTYIHSFIHTYIHTYIHAYIRTYIRMYTHIYFTNISLRIHYMHACTSGKLVVGDHPRVFRVFPSLSARCIHAYQEFLFSLFRVRLAVASQVFFLPVSSVSKCLAVQWL